jgi:D-alanine-D-alanine ligase
MARIDFFLSGEEIYFNEINTIPGMTKDSIYPKMLESSGISRDDFVRMIILDTVSGA